jgi:hypothetical protein
VQRLFFVVIFAIILIALPLLALSNTAISIDDAASLKNSVTSNISKKGFGPTPGSWERLGLIQLSML